MSNHLLTLLEPDWSRERIEALVERAASIKADPESQRSALAGRTLLMLFAKPSLRTRVSFEVGMTQLGGHAIWYSTADSPLGAKETMADAARVLSRYVDIVMARLFEHADLVELADHSDVPIINALTNLAHPVQVLSDLLTIHEHKGKRDGLTLAYLGDANNNVTHSLISGCARVGIGLRVGCPNDPAYRPQGTVEAAAREIASAELTITDDASVAVRGADIVYTDSWMSYHIDAAEAATRRAQLQPYQVDGSLMAQAAPEAIFMNCLPALRGDEQTAEVIDGPQSVVFDQAENRLHLQKALMLELLAR